MTDGRRRAWIGALLAAFAAFVAWLLWPRPAETPPSELICALAVRPIDAESKPRAERRRDVAAPDAPPAKPGDVVAKQPAAAKTDAEETFLFTATVVRADGTPAAGATVALLDFGEGRAHPAEAARATADEKGVATMRAPDTIVRVTAWLGAEAGSPRDLVGVKDTRSLTVRLSPGIAMHGRVVMTGAAVAGADVTMTARPWFQSENGVVLTTKSDADGRFAFPPIEEAGIDPLNPPYVGAATEDLATGCTDEISLESLRRGTDVVVELVPGFSVHARIVDADGKPVAHAVVRAYGATHTAESDGDGRVSLRLPHGGAKLFLVVPTGKSYFADFDGENPVVGVWSKEQPLGKVEDVAGDVALGDVVVKPGLPLKGVVVDPAGKPSAHATVRLFLDDMNVGESVTAADGRFLLPEVGPEPHKLFVREATTPDSETSRFARIEGVHGGDPDLRVVLGGSDSAIVAFRFLADGDRTPITAPEATVKAFRHGEKDECGFCQVSGAGLDGASLQLRAAGSYDVEVTVAGYEPQRFESVEVVAGRPTTLDLLLRKKHE